MQKRDLNKLESVTHNCFTTLGDIYEVNLIQLSKTNSPKPFLKVSAFGEVYKDIIPHLLGNLKKKEMDGISSPDLNAGVSIPYFK